MDVDLLQVGFLDLITQMSFVLPLECFRGLVHYGTSYLERNRCGRAPYLLLEWGHSGEARRFTFLSVKWDMC
jgi:hypothetical protein